MTISLFDSLPVEVTVRIFTFLDGKSLIAASMSCELFNKIVKDQFLSQTYWADLVSYEKGKYIVKRISREQDQALQRLSFFEKRVKFYNQLDCFGNLRRFFNPSKELESCKKQFADLKLVEKSKKKVLEDGSFVKEHVRELHELESQIRKSQKKVCCLISCKIGVISTIAVGILAVAALIIYGFTLLLLKNAANKS